jgi:hypothetical protein
VLGELVPFKDRIEDWPRYEVLSQHFDGVIFIDAGIERSAQPFKELIETLAVLVVRIFEQCLDSSNVPLGDLGDILGPGFPISPAAALKDDLGEDCVSGM